MSKPIKKNDQWAYEYLAQQNFSDLVYEPDGNVPPDFLINGHIAVEARRFNHNEEGSETDPVGLEELWKPLETTVTTVIESMGPPLPPAPSSWFVHYAFKRPVPPRKDLKRLLAAALRSFMDQPDHQPRKLRVSPSFTLSLHRASNSHSTFFVLGGSTDRDYVSFVMAAAIRNLKTCIADKTRAVASHRSRYPEWWLLLEDHISYGDFDASEGVRLREFAQLNSNWDKIILVNPNNRAAGLEL